MPWSSVTVTTMADSGSLVNFADTIEPAADNDELNRSGPLTVDEAGMTSSGSLQTNHAGAAMMSPAIEFCSNENTPLLLRSEQFHVGIISGNYNAEDREFGEIFCDAERAIDHHGIYPQRILQGSSGSYFVKNSNGVGILIITFLSQCLTVIVIVIGSNDTFNVGHSAWSESRGELYPRERKKFWAAHSLVQSFPGNRYS